MTEEKNINAGRGRRRIIFPTHRADDSPGRVPPRSTAATVAWPPPWLISPPSEPEMSREAEQPDEVEEVADAAAEPTPEPPEYARLRGPRRTPWGTLCWSDPSAPP